MCGVGWLEKRSGQTKRWERGAAKLENYGLNRGVRAGIYPGLSGWGRLLLTWKSTVKLRSEDWEGRVQVGVKPVCQDTS